MLDDGITTVQHTLSSQREQFPLALFFDHGETALSCSERTVSCIRGKMHKKTIIDSSL